MIIAVSGSVGSGKTTFAKALATKLKFELINLTDWAREFKIGEITELQTFDFDFDLLLEKVEKYIRENEHKNIIFESHFAHLIYPDIVDYIVILTRDLKELKKVYEERKYNEKKIADNLEVESFNLCFYEALEEGFDTEQIILLENNCDIGKLVEKTIKKIEFFE